jgi:hypothetical protein
MNPGSRSPFAAALAAAVLLGACSSPPEEEDRRDVGPRDDSGGADADADTPADLPAETPAEADSIDAECYQDLDIVFVLDVSTSMTPILGALEDGIGDVWSQALTISPDPQFGLVVFVDDVNVTNDGLPYDSVGAIQGQFAYWREFCGSEVEPGGSPGLNIDCPENTLDAVWTAATTFPWRENSLRIMILATDDTFRENPQTLGSARLTVQHTYAETVGELQSRQIRVAAFAAHDSSDCSIPPVHDTEPGFFAPWGDQPPFGEATGADVFDIMEVRSGDISMTEAINGVILEEYCTPYLI